jgi:hypothetical protein
MDTSVLPILLVIWTLPCIGPPPQRPQSCTRRSEKAVPSNVTRRDSLGLIKNLIVPRTNDHLSEKKFFVGLSARQWQNHQLLTICSDRKRSERTVSLNSYLL